MQRIFKYIGGDKAIWMVVLFMALASILLVYSSIVTLAYKYQDGNTLYYFLKHAVFIVSGFFFIYFIHKLDYKYFSRIAQLLFWVSIPLLLLTLVMGANLNNASRWLVIPIINQSFQTSDLAKLALIMFTARSLAVRKDQLKDFNKGFIPLLVPVAVICVLILPANFSTAAVLFTSCLMLMFMAGIRVRHISVLLPTAIVGLGMVYLIGVAKPDLFPRLDTWINRVERFVGNEEDRDGNFQVEQAKIAIASGGALGKGPGNSTQRNFLPHPYSDFIYAIVLEEYGMMGGFVVLLFYLVLLYRSIKIVQKVESDFGAFLVLGLSFSLVFQGLINMAVNVNILPVTGQPLPLVSMGGTSLWFTCISLGIILSVSRSVEQETEESPKKGGNYVVS